MRRKYKRRIKKLIINEVVYKIYNRKDNKFKESDVKKAYNLIPDDEKKDYIIVKIKNKVKELEQIDY